MLRAFSFVTAFLLSGCASHIPLAKQVPAVEYVIPKLVVVSVIDDRQRVKKGKAKTFIGVAHGTFGIPFDLHIKSVLAVEDGDEDRDLAQFLQFRIARGFAEKGWSTAELGLAQVPSEDEARNLLEEREAGSLLVLKISEWFFSLNLSWVTAFNFDTDTEVFIYRREGMETFAKRFAGRDVIDVEAFGSYQNHILIAYREQLAEILNDPEVKQAFSPP